MALTAEQQEAKNTTFTAVSQGVEDGVAAFVKENYELIRVLSPALPESAGLSNADYRNFAKELIDKRSINGMEIKNIQAKIADTPTAKTFVSGRGANSIEELIPTRDQVSMIANEAGEAAAGNVGGIRGTTPGNAAKGLLNYALTWGKKGSAAEPAANSVRNDATARLTELTKNNSKISLFLGANEIDKIGDQMYAGVLEAAAKKRGEKIPAKPDPLDKIAVKPIDAAQREAVYDAFGEKVYEESKKGIETTVKTRMDEALGTGFLRMIFNFLESLGLGKIVAGLFGYKIPEQVEMSNAAHIMSESAKETVSAHAASMTQADLLSTVRKNTFEKLKANRDEFFPSFTDEQLTEMSIKAAKGIKDNYDAIPKIAIAGNEAVQQQANAAAQASRDITRGGNEATNTPAQVPGAPGQPGQGASLGG